MFSTKRSRPYNIFFGFVQIILKTVLRAFYRVELEGLSNIKKEGSIILCSNHISYADPLIIGAFFPRPVYFMAKIELFKNPILASIVRFFNSFAVKREKTDIRSIKISIDILENDQVLGIFPEGTRSPEGKLLRGQKGISFIAIKSGTPILPVAVSGTNKIVQKPHKRLFFPKVRVKFGKQIDTEDYLKKYGKKESETLILRDTMDTIKRLYEEIAK